MLFQTNNPTYLSAEYVIEQTMTQKKYEIKEDALLDYAADRESLSIEQVRAILDCGLKLGFHTEIANALVNGGCALFPHAYITQCGDHIAAVVHASLLACQISGKNQLLAIGVVHSLTDRHREARKREMNGADLTNEPCRGIFGPGLPNEELLSKEYSLDHFIFLLYHAAKMNGIEPPKVILRYPNLVRGHPETLAGIEELKQLSKASIVVATSDLCHHGKAYGMPPERIFPISQTAYNLARANIEEGLRLLSGDNLLEFRKHSYDTISDSVEVGQLLRYLLGPLEGSICDLRLVDVSYQFEDNPTPSWVASTLVELKRRKTELE